MSKFAKTLLASAVLSAAGAAASAAELELSNSVALTSNYIFRGISQTDNQPAVQVSFDAAHSGGLYAGIWGSNVNFNEGGTSTEFDLYAGFADDLGSGLSYDLAGIYYLYPGANDPSNGEFNYWEAKAALSYAMEDLQLKPKLGFALYYSPEFFGEIGDAVYYDVSLELTLIDNLSLHAHGGLQDLKKSQAGVGSYTDWGVGVATEYSGFGFDLSYTGTDNDADTFSLGRTDLTKDRIQFTISRSF